MNGWRDWIRQVTLQFWTYLDGCSVDENTELWQVMEQIDDHRILELVHASADRRETRAGQTGGTADATVMEAPRRPGAVYGEEYRQPDAEAVVEAVVEAVREGRPLPPTPSYPPA
jgi:hypothetical protein